MTTILAAGAVVWRRTASGVEVAVVHRPRYDDWSLPMGRQAGPGESMPFTAVREIAEGPAVRRTCGTVSAT